MAYLSLNQESQQRLVKGSASSQQAREKLLFLRANTRSEVDGLLGLHDDDV